VMICLLVYAIARRVTSDSIAATAALVTALFPPIPYFGALVMTEVWTTFLFTASVWLAVLALADADSPDSWRNVGVWIGLGISCGLTTLSRPAFVLFPILLAVIGLMLFPLIRIRTSIAFAPVMVMLVAFAVVMLPWFAYNYEHVGRFTLSPAGGVGRGLWEGSWQAVWSGRLQSELTTLAEQPGDRVEIDRQVTAVASREQLPPQPMLEYVHQWKELHLIWDAPTDPYQRTMARMQADRSYLLSALQNLRHDRPMHQLRRMTRGAIILWVGEIPFRYSDINRLPPALIRLCWLIQAALLTAAMAGIYALFRHFPAAACILAAPIVYVTAVHLPLLTEARQSLPAQPVLLVLATLGTAHLLGYRLQPHVTSRRSADA
jgi:4-amino-4-deoxy-L-arabinose transferase-like glycosyltransferase